MRRVPAPGDSFNTADGWSRDTAVQTSSDVPAAQNKFGERMLVGARCFRGRVPSERWRQSTDELQKKMIGNGTGGVEPADVERFFRDLGFDPEADISRRLTCYFVVFLYVCIYSVDRATGYHGSHLH